MVHTFVALGCPIVLDVNSGAVHVLDQMTYDVLHQVENLESLPEFCPAEVKTSLP